MISPNKPKEATDLRPSPFPLPKAWRSVLLASLPCILLLLSSLCLSKQTRSQTLLKNLTPDPLAGKSSHPFHFREGGLFAYFWAVSQNTFQLWRTGGAPKSTILLLDHQRNPNHRLMPEGAGWKNLFFFQGWNPKTGFELYRSDGTPKGTFLLADLAPGLDPYGANLPLSSEPKDFVSLPQGMFFQAWTGKDKWTLFISDGTAKGIIPLYTSNQSLSGIKRMGNKVVFKAKSVSYGTEGLGISDGTVQGTRIFFADPLVQTSLEKGKAAVLNGRLFFAANHFFAFKGEELWVSDGTKKGTKLFKDLWPGPQSSSPRNFKTSGSFCYFSAEDPKHGRELWRTDGTVSGTRLVKDLAPGGGSTPISSKPRDLVALKKGILFTAETPKEGREPWFSDGTPSGTRLIANINKKNLSSKPSNLLSLGSFAVFTAQDPQGKRTLYRVDPSPLKLTALLPLSQTKNYYATPFGLGRYGNQFLFRNADEKGEEPWISDGTKNGTSLLKDLEPERYSPIHSQPKSFRQIGDQVFFSYFNTQGRPRVGQTNGTEKGTRKRWEGSYQDLTPIGNRLLSFNYWASQFQLLSWEKNREKPEILLENIHLVPYQGDFSPYFYRSGILVAASPSFFGKWYWWTDGTRAGTRSFFPLGPVDRRANQILSQAIPFGGRVLIAGPYQRSKDKAIPLWWTDGTKAGSKLIANLPIGYGLSAFDMSGRQLGTKAVLSVKAQNWATKQTAFALLATDGKTLQPLVQGVQSQAPQFALLGKNLLFSLETNKLGKELWISDGTPKGTRMLQDLNPGPLSSDPQSFVPLGNKLLFTAETNTTGRELFITDGTHGGTKLLRDTHPGFGSGIVSGSPLVRVGSRHVVFFATDGKKPRQFWITDGTSAGTHPYGAPLPDAGPYSKLKEPSFVRGSLYFSWRDQRHGREPWILPLPANARSFGFGCGGPLRLEASDPVLGKTLTLQGNALAPKAPALLLLGSVPTTPQKLSKGCWLDVDPFKFFITVPLQTRTGKWSLGFTLPKVPSLSGLFLRAQVLHPKTGGLALSNPVELLLGNS